MTPAQLLLLSSLLVFIPEGMAGPLSSEQVYWANYAFQLGDKYGLGSTLAAMEGQESSYCKFKRLRWSVGCLGTKRATVRAIFDPAATRERLESDNEYSINAGLSILLYCRQRTKNWRESLLCFHYGEFVEQDMVSHKIPYDPDNYIGAIIKRMDEIKEDTN